MIKIVYKHQCCGCNACVQRCPKQCIKMQEDNEGFLYPNVDESTCIGCGLCETVCPCINLKEPKRPLKVLAAKNNKEYQRLRSSSGGIFVLLAEKMIHEGGVVFGARFDDKWEVFHDYTETIADIEPFMRSKYMQSRIEDSYKKAESFLKLGRKVLFIGSPCQIAGLKLYLRIDYDNLLSVDIVCHGVPSPGIWRQYLSEEYGDVTNLKFVSFREKQLSGFTWENYGVKIADTLSSKSMFYKENPFMKAFNNELISRPSCFNCPAKDGKSGSDLALADFWGIDNVAPEFNDDKGVSLLIVHTNKGREFITDLDIQCIESNYETVCQYNKSYCSSAIEKQKDRSKFWRGLEENNSVTQACAIALHRTLLSRIINRILRCINR